MFQLTCLVVISASIFQLGVLGEDNCLDNPITEIALSASDHVSGFPPSDGFLDNPNGAWCSQTAPPGAYLQVNFNNLHIVCAVAVQGFANSTTEFFTTKYKLSYTLDNSVWAFYKNESHQDAEFQGSSDNGTTTETTLLPSTIGQVKAIRLHPTDINGSLTCLRVAVYGKRTLNVTCDSTQMTIVIIKGGLGPDINKVHMNDATPDCSFNVSPDSDTRFSLPVGSCGAQVTSNEDYFFLANTVHGKVDVSGSLIVTRTYDVTFKVNCSFPRNGSVSVSYRPNSGFSVTGTEYGRFVVSIKGYLDANLTDELDENDPPLSLGTDVFIQMEVIANDTDVTLHVLRCWLTEVENRNNDPQFNLIVSGCPVDDNYDYTCDNTSVQTFHFPAFKLPSSDKVYLHCNVLLCLPDDPENRCKRECDECSTQGGVARRSLERNGVNRESRVRHLDFGPFNVEPQEDSIPRKSSSTGLSTQTVIVVSVASVAMFFVLCGTVAVTVTLLQKVCMTGKCPQPPSPPQASMESPILSKQNI